MTISSVHHSHGHMPPLYGRAGTQNRKVDCRAAPRGRNWAIILTFLSVPVVFIVLSVVALFALMA